MVTQNSILEENRENSGQHSQITDSNAPKQMH